MALMTWLWVRTQARWTELTSADQERGDVPGWVMVTVMSAGLVVAVFAVFRQAIVEAVQTAIAGVVSSTGG
ncbi:MAG: hypothetical protein QOC93_225 [Actinomycetota bacterium]|jgi:hypothetical protein|nr:hypothetical protein [Actinomycetota bacterium]